MTRKIFSAAGLLFQLLLPWIKGGVPPVFVNPGCPGSKGVPQAFNLHQSDVPPAFVTLEGVFLQFLLPWRGMCSR